MILMTLASAYALDPEALRAGAEIQLTPDYAQGVRDGLELIYLRRYDDARSHFRTFEQTHPGSGLEPVADVLVWQALMLENFDFRYDKEYWAASKAVRKELGRALKVDGNDAWEHFIFGGMVGIEAIHQARTGKYLSALSLAFEAMDHVEESRKRAPGFTDMLLADGMYNYWRTVVTDWSSMLPDFGDHKAEGIDQMRTVQDRGIFLSAPSTLALSFSYIQEGQKQNAKGSVDRMRAAYPDNVINNLVAGSVYVQLRKYDTAKAIFNEVLEDSPDNARAVYWRGLTEFRSGDLDAALADFTRYNAIGYLEDEQRSMAQYRIGRVHYARKDFATAEDWFEKSNKTDSNKRAKTFLERIDAKRKAGEL